MQGCTNESPRTGTNVQIGIRRKDTDPWVEGQGDWDVAGGSLEWSDEAYRIVGYAPYENR